MNDNATLADKNHDVKNNNDDSDNNHNMIKMTKITMIMIFLWCCYITVTSSWARWRLKSPASPLFTQPFIQAQIKETLKRSVTGLCMGNSPLTGEFPAQMASNAENVSILWRHHDGKQALFVLLMSTSAIINALTVFIKYTKSNPL